MRKTRSDDHIRCDIVIDRQIHPELFESLSKISDTRRRASFLRICAEKYIISQTNSAAYTAGLQRYSDGHVSYQPAPGKAQLSPTALTARTHVSAVPDERGQHTPPGSEGLTTPHPSLMAPETATPDAAPVQSNLESTTPPVSLTARSLVSTKQGGASMLAGVLGDMTPGLM